MRKQQHEAKSGKNREKTQLKILPTAQEVVKGEQLFCNWHDGEDERDDQQQEARSKQA